MFSLKNNKRCIVIKRKNLVDGLLILTHHGVCKSIKITSFEWDNFEDGAQLKFKASTNVYANIIKEMKLIGNLTVNVGPDNLLYVIFNKG